MKNWIFSTFFSVDSELLWSFYAFACIGRCNQSCRDCCMYLSVWTIDQLVSNDQLVGLLFGCLFVHLFAHIKRLRCIFVCCRRRRRCCLFVLIYRIFSYWKRCINTHNLKHHKLAAVDRSMSLFSHSLWSRHSVFLCMCMVLSLALSPYNVWMKRF